MLTNEKEKLAAIVGAENVIDDPAKLASFAGSDGFVKGIAPELIVRPSDARQVVELVKWANDSKTPLVPVSSGGPRHRRGGSVPAAPQAVMVDMSGMKKIFSVSDTFRMAVLEPGVTHGELQAELSKYGLMLDMPLAPRADKSVLASILETEPRLNPNMQWCSTEPLRSTEVVWGDGVLMRTGEAAGAPLDVPAEEAIAADQANHGWMISPNGPDTFDYYRMITGAQGTMGIITWASVKCARIPEVHNMFLAPAEELESAVEFMYNVEHIRFGDSLFLLSGFALASLMGDSAGEIEKLAAKLPRWVCCASAASRPPLPEMRASAQAKGLADMAKKAGLELVTQVSGITGEAVMKKAFGVCEPGKYWKDTFEGAAADIFFLTTMDRVPAFAAKFGEVARARGFDPEKVAVTVQPKHQGVNCSLEFSIPYDPGCPRSAAKAKELFEAASKELADLGAYYSRPYGKWARMQLGKDAMSAATLKKLKDIFDPAGVMNPGRLSAY